MKRMNAIRAQGRRAIHAATRAVTHAAILAEKTITTAADIMEDRSREDNLKYEPYKIHFIAPYSKETASRCSGAVSFSSVSIFTYDTLLQAVLRNEARSDCFLPFPSAHDSKLPLLQTAVWQRPSVH